MRELIFVHGRAQEDKDALDLKKTWIGSFQEGLDTAGLQMPIAEEHIRFPYYGDTLRDLVKELPEDQVAKIIVRGDNADANEEAFIREYILEVQEELGIDEQEILAEGGQEVVQKGPLNWEWVHTVLKVIDRRVPGGSGASVALATKDVYQYLTRPTIRETMHEGIRQAFSDGKEKVVVSHSLGTVVAYNLLRTEAETRGWKIPLFVTLGSPLGIKVIRKKLAQHAPLKHPAGVGKWFNALDQRDVVALYPLTRKAFRIDPEIENKTDIDNHTENRHGIIGYLNDAEVARRIHAALVA